LRTVAYGFGRGPGFDVERTAFLGLQPSIAEFFEATEGPNQTGAEGRKALAYTRLLDGLKALPGVEAVASGSAPLRPDVTSPIRLSSVTANAVARQLAVLISSNPPGYLEALGVPLIAGRELTLRDATTVR